jgi:long-chain acyl-CoA synthetase
MSMNTASTPLDFKTIHDIPAYWAERTPEAIALLEPDSGITYARLGAYIDHARRLLEGKEVRAGQRVMLIAENCAALVAFIFASTSVGACPVIVNARLSVSEIDSIATHCDPQAIVFISAGFDSATAHAKRFGAYGHVFLELGEIELWSATSPASVEPGTEDLAALIYTSGTTGAPKGVMLSHSNLLFSSKTMANYRKLSASDRTYAVLPMSHSMGLTSVLLSTLVVGASVVIAARFEVERLIDVLQTRNITLFQGVQAMYTSLLGHLQRTEQKCLRHNLRYIYTGGSPLDPTLKLQVEELFGLPLHNGYGATEASPTICHSTLGERRTDAAVGPPIPGIQIRIVDVNDQDVEQGEAGELWVRGPNVMRGYFRNAEATTATFYNDWLKTGDLASLDATNNVHLVGRLKDIIIRSGFNVYPVEVETALNTHPAVERSAVVGRNIPLNEEVVAFVEIKSGQATTAKVLQNWLKDRLSPYKRPSEIIFLSSLPLLPSGKVRKNELKDLAQRTALAS